MALSALFAALWALVLPLRGLLVTQGGVAERRGGNALGFQNRNATDASRWFFRTVGAARSKPVS